MRKIIILTEANATTKTSQYLAAKALEDAGKPVPAHLKKALAWGKANPESVERVRKEKDADQIASAGLAAKAGRKAKTLVAQSKDAVARNKFETAVADEEEGKTHREHRSVDWRGDDGRWHSGSTSSVELDNPEAFHDAEGKGMIAGVRSQEKLRGARAYVKAGQKIKKRSQSGDDESSKKAKEDLRGLDASVDSRTFRIDRAAGSAQRLSKSNSPGATKGAARKSVAARKSNKQFSDDMDVFRGADAVKDRLGIRYTDEHGQSYTGKGVSGEELYLPRDRARADKVIGKTLSDDTRKAAAKLSDDMRSPEAAQKVRVMKAQAASKAEQKRFNREENEKAHRRNIERKAEAERKEREKRTGLPTGIDPEDF